MDGFIGTVEGFIVIQRSLVGSAVLGVTVQTWLKDKVANILADVVSVSMQ